MKKTTKNTDRKMEGNLLTLSLRTKDNKFSFFRVELETSIFAHPEGRHLAWREQKRHFCGRDRCITEYHPHRNGIQFTEGGG